jgi:transposase InsO family protein
LNLRIKPRKRLKRDKPDALTVPDAPNLVWSMDFMADRLEDGRQFRLLNVLDDFNREGQGLRWTFRCLLNASSGVWIRSSNGAANRWPFVWTMGPSTSVAN